jgi:hypothetical protein
MVARSYRPDSVLTSVFTNCPHDVHGSKQSSIDVAPSNQQASPKSMAGKLAGRYKNAPERSMNTRHLAAQQGLFN